MSAKRRTLEDFTCIDTISYCHRGCDGFMNCEIGEAYREYLKLLKCARLLLSFEGDYADMASAAMLMSDSVNVDEWGDFREFVVSCAVALRAAGLKQTRLRSRE